MPCFDRICRFGHYRCLTEVAPERVLARARATPRLRPRARTCRRRRSARSAGRWASRRRARALTASVSAPASTLPRSATVPLPPGRRPSERGAPGRRHRPELERAVGLDRDRHDRPRHQGRAVAADARDQRAPAASRRAPCRWARGRRRSAAAPALGLASSTARPIAATLANAARPRQNGSRFQAPLARRRSSPPPMRSEMRRQTSPEGCTGCDRGGERHQPLFPGAGRFAQHRMRRQQALEAAPRRAAQGAGGVFRGEAVGELGAAVVHGQSLGAAPSSRCTRALQAALEREQRAPHPRLDRAERLAQLLGHLGMAEALVEGERDALPLQRAELVHALAERPRIGRPAQQVERAGRCVGHGVVHVVVLGVGAAGGGTLGLQSGLRLLAPQAVDGAVAGDAGQPGEGLALGRVEAARGAPDVDVDLLEDVLGLRAIPVDTQHHGEQMRAGALVERGKCRTIAEAGTGRAGATARGCARSSRRRV